MIHNSVKSFIHLANRTDRKYNILTFPTHERYETQLCKTGHNFYSFNLNQHKKWNKKQCDVPENYYILPENELPNYINYDFILSQSKFWQFQTAQKINQSLNIPIISLEHTWPLYGIQKDSQLTSMREMIGNVNVFISESSMNAWDIGVDSHVIHHGIDIDKFKPQSTDKQKHVLTVANDFKNRDYCLNYSGWKRITDKISTRLVGESSGLSEPARSVDDLVNEYNQCQVYLNTSSHSPIPTSLLEAMSCGCAVVSTATCMIPEVIENGYNGFISNDESELTNYINMIMEDNNLRDKLGNNARKTIEEKFPESKFISEWNNLFDNIYEVFNT